MIAGVLIRNGGGTSKKLGKNIRQFQTELVSRNQYQNAIATINGAQAQDKKDLEDAKALTIRAYVASNQHKTDFLNSIRPEIQRGLSFVHDYKQLNSQIAQHINVIIESKLGGMASFEEKFARATENERAIYWASRLMAEKLNTAKFLVNPEWINRASECSEFRFHGLVHKYLGLYDAVLKQRDLKLEVSGESWLSIYANQEAVGVIPHTLLDNASKYSPTKIRSPVEVHIQDANGSISFSVASFGPLIHADEKQRVFEPFYRGREARQAEEEGSGYGLYVAQTIAKAHLGTNIELEQHLTAKPRFGYWTTFSISIPKRASGVTE